MLHKLYDYEHHGSRKRKFALLAGAVIFILFSGTLWYILSSPARRALPKLAFSFPPERFVFAFGDSYTSTGFNISKSKPSYWNQLGNPKYPGYTTCGFGPNWLDIILSKSPPNTLFYNLAHGGATVDGSIDIFNTESFDFNGQVDNFTTFLSPPPSYAKWTASNSIFLIWFSTNDLLGSLNWWYDKSPIPAQIFDSYFADVQRLVSMGATRFLILTASPLDRTPHYLANEEQAALLQDAVTKWNAALQRQFFYFNNAHPNVFVESLDVHALFTRMLDDPMAYGAPNASCFDGDAKSCLWTDQYHPGLEIHRVLGEKAFEILKEGGFYEAT